MYFKQYHNCYFRELGPHPDGGVMIEIAPGQFAKYQGCIDRSIARILPGAQQIALDFAGWRLRELDAWQWLSEDQALVGCLIEQGVLAVLDHQRPLIKKRSSLIIQAEGR
jgi:hypothetical protein